MPLRYAVCTVALAALMLTLTLTCAVAQPQAAPAANPAPGPLVLSPSVAGGAAGYLGWPLVLELTIWRETPADAGTAAPEPLTVTAKQGSWPEALVVTVKNAEDKLEQWPLHLVAQQGAKLSLAAGEVATAEWWLAPEETRALPEGGYAISVAFDPQRVEGLPTGAAAPRADVCHLRLLKEPATLNADLTATKVYQQAWYSLVRGDKAGAEGAIGQLLAADPKSIGARRLRALLAAREGRVEEALAQVEEALSLYVAKHPKACPPIGLLNLRDQLEAQGDK